MGKINIKVRHTLHQVKGMEYAIAKISSKGQLVIPSNLRKDIKTGEEFLIVKDGNRMILKNIKDVADELKDDLKFAQKVDKAWQEYEKGRFKKSSKKDFLEELKAC
ncbi:MAG: AbrB/MazE/SpoVT family DNA-binding domain-containing protein [Nanoarchaeota archaeon]